MHRSTWFRNSFRYAGRQHRDAIVKSLKPVYTAPSNLSCRSLVTQDFLDYCCGVGGYVGLGGDGLTGDLDGDLA